MLPTNVPTHQGKENAITDIPSCSFGTEPKWHFKSNTELCTFFNSHFRLPNQTSWNVLQIQSDVTMRVISILQTKHFLLDKWRQLPKLGSITGPIGPNMSHLWDLTLTYRTHHLHGKSEHSQDLPPEHDKKHTARDAKSNLAQSLAMSRPLVRCFPWLVEPTW
jgi:hypothetical protein